MFEVFNEAGDSLIVPNRSTMVVSESGVLTTSSPTGVGTLGRMPRGMLVARPPVGGNVFISYDYDTSFDSSRLVQISGTAGTQWAVLKAVNQGEGVLRPENVGLEVFGSDGALEFTSRGYVPRLIRSAIKPPTLSTGGMWPFNITGLPSVSPWIDIHHAISTGKGIGEFTESAGSIYIKRTGQSSYQVNFRIVGAGAFYDSGNGTGTYDSAFDTLDVVPAEFFIFAIAGL